MYPLEHRTALVTGASRGIGAAVARRLAASGARVALVARSAAALESLADELGGGAVALPCDVRDPAALHRSLRQLPGMLGAVPDIIVNNAGAFFLAPVQDTTVESFRDSISSNLIAPFSVVQALLPGLLAQQRGHVVTIGSIADRATFPGNGAYAAGKFGLRALHEVLRAELRGTGVRVSLVSPGPVNTGLWDALDPESQAGVTPRSAMLTPEAVADAVHYVVTAPLSLNVDELRLSRT